MSNMSMGLESQGLRKLSSVKIPDYFWDRISTNIPVMNEFLNGDGLVKSQCITLSSSRGSGKTTLLLQTMQALIEANKNFKAAYLSGEEMVEQLAFNAQRYNAMDVVADNVTDVDSIANVIAQHQLVVIDSVSAMTHPEFRGRHLEEYACNTLIKAAKQHKCIVVFIQHFTKAGQEKGGTIWGHAVDTVLKLHKMDIEEYGENVRMIEVEKNRFGSCTELMLKMTKEGFDFENVLNVRPNDSAKGGNRAVNKVNEMKKIVDIVTSKGNAAMTDFKDICDDMGRIERLVKELEKAGRIVKIGRAATAYYTLGD